MITFHNVDDSGVVNTYDPEGNLVRTDPYYPLVPETEEEKQALIEAIAEEFRKSVDELAEIVKQMRAMLRTGEPPLLVYRGLYCSGKNSPFLKVCALNLLLAGKSMKEDRCSTKNQSQVRSTVPALATLR